MYIYSKKFKNMGKYARDLHDGLERKVKSMAQSVGLTDMGISIEAIRLKKSKNSIGEVVQGNDLVKLFTGEENLVAVALYEDAFLCVDDQTQNLWIEGLLSQISYDEEKEKVIITKPELQMSLGMYRKYGNVATQKYELALMTVQQLAEKTKAEKDAKKKNK
jgi:hypothetical protein